MLQERIKNEYPSITLPEEFQEQNRGYDKCCEPYLVLASPDAESWKNDVSSAWIKLSDPTDTATIELQKSDGTPLSTYTTTTSPFVNEPNAYYATIRWQDVLADEGIGCYRIVIEYDISGLTGTIVWGVYDLKQYSIENALYTARLRCFLNLQQTIEGINFTGTNVEDSIRFNGQIDKDQPNIEFENLIYGTRRVETVVNESKQSYLMETDGYTDELLTKLERLYLLSSNEIFLADYNAHSNSYNILDVPVIVSESPERQQPARHGRFKTLTCKFNDRVQNKRTYY